MGLKTRSYVIRKYYSIFISSKISETSVLFLSNLYRSLINLPGTSLLPTGVLFVAYGLFLGWLFFGIAIVADIFMDAIEVITSKTT